MHQISFKFDGGYGKINLLLSVDAKGYSMSTIACKSGSFHLFIVWKDADDYISKLQNINDEDKEEKLNNLRASFLIAVKLEVLRFHMRQRNT